MLETLTKKTIHICLVFLLAVVPLIVNPTAVDYWYKPKIDSVYALVIIIAGCIMLRCAKAKTGIPLTAGPLTLPLAVFACSAVVSTILSVDVAKSIWGDAWREEGLWTLISYVALTVAFSSLPESQQQIERLFKGLIAATALIACYGLMQYSGLNLTEHFIPLYRCTGVGSTIGNPNFLGKFFVLTLPLFLTYVWAAASRRAAAGYAAGFLLALCALLLTFTRASWIGFGVSLLVFAGLAMRQHPIRFRHTLGFLSLTVLSAAVLLFIVCRAGNRSNDFLNEFSGKMRSAVDLRAGSGSATRLFVWRETIAVILKKPLFGYGPDAHETALRSLNLRYSRAFNDWVIIDRAHNNYLDLAVAQGLFGLAAYLWIVAVFIKFLVNAVRTAPDRRDRLLYSGLLSGVCGYLVNDCFIFSTVSVSPTFWSLMGLGLAYHRLARR